MAATITDGLKPAQLLSWGTDPIENIDNWEYLAQNLWQGMPNKAMHMGRMDDEDKIQRFSVDQGTMDVQRDLVRLYRPFFFASIMHSYFLRLSPILSRKLDVLDFDQTMILVPQ